jgi:hypothetical protein
MPLLSSGQNSFDPHDDMVNMALYTPLGLLHVLGMATQEAVGLFLYHGPRKLISAVEREPDFLRG